MDYLPYGKHWIGQDDIEAVEGVLESDWLTTGPKVREFEEALAEEVGAKYVVAVNSGTAALHAAYFAAGVGAGDEVITSPITFAATANAACYLGAKPVFLDVLRDTMNIDPSLIENRITERTKAITPVDFTGHPADIDQILAIARKHNLVMVEDAAHALGASYRGKSVGSWADMTIFSFHPVKHITTGEGGAISTNNKLYYEKLLAFRNHGIIREPEKMQDYHGPWYHEMQFLGYNYRITDFQCALGISQLKKLNRFIHRRREIAHIYFEELAGLDEIELPQIRPEVQHAWHLFVIRLKGQNPKRRQLYVALQKREVGVQVHYIPVHWHPFYQNLGYQKGTCPVAEDYYSRCLSLPIFPAMTDDQAKKAACILREEVQKLRSNRTF